MTAVGERRHPWLSDGRLWDLWQPVSDVVPRSEDGIDQCAGAALDLGVSRTWGYPAGRVV